LGIKNTQKLQFFALGRRGDVGDSCRGAGLCHTVHEGKAGLDLNANVHPVKIETDRKAPVVSMEHPSVSTSGQTTSLRWPSVSHLGNYENNSQVRRPRRAGIGWRNCLGQYQGQEESLARHITSAIQAYRIIQGPLLILESYGWPFTRKVESKSPQGKL
jgi:hypothetical protein